MGRAFAQTLADDGVAVGLIDVAEATLSETHATLGSRRAKSARRLADVVDDAGITTAFNELEDELGAIDLVIHCAGILRTGLFTDQAPEDFERVVAVNLLGTANVVRASTPALRKTQGAIACLASTAALHGWPEMSAYSSSKFGVAGYCDAVRPELEAAGIGMTTVFPLLIDTPMLKGAENLAPILTAGKSIPAQTVVNKTFAGLRRGKRRIYVPGTVRLITALHGVAPGLLDLYGKRFGMR
jgi:3-oxoacyl-[acyl-carrier protein] reductase